MRFAHAAAGLLLAGFIGACASTPPAQVEDVCEIFEEKDGWFDNWHKAAKQTSHRHGVSVPVLMATLHQESRFRPKARPPRRRVLWFIPWRRPSSAYGFAQVLDTTWADYQRRTGRRRADRDDFRDAVEFVGWYHARSHERNGIARDDAYHLYLAYHEGQGGFERGTHQNKTWLHRVARKVQDRSRLYAFQYERCRQ